MMRSLVMGAAPDIVMFTTSRPTVVPVSKNATTIKEETKHEQATTMVLKNILSKGVLPKDLDNAST